MNIHNVIHLDLSIRGDTTAEHIARLPRMVAALAPTAVFPGEWPHRPGGYMPPRFEHSRVPLGAWTRRSMEQDL